MSNQPLSEREIVIAIHASLKAGGKLQISGHAELRMLERGIDEQQLGVFLRKGRADGCDPVAGRWRYRRRCGDIVVVVVLDPPSKTSVVTVINTRN
jgi:hypothetical protein